MLIFRRTIELVQHLVSSLSLGDCSVRRLREDSHNLCTEQSPKESDDNLITCVLNSRLKTVTIPDAVKVKVK